MTWVLVVPYTIFAAAAVVVMACVKLVLMLQRPKPWMDHNQKRFLLIGVALAMLLMQTSGLGFLLAVDGYF